MATRRQFLKAAGIGSTSLLLTPFLQNMMAHAAGKESGLPMRFVFLSKSNEMRPSTLLPSGFENYDDNNNRQGMVAESTQGMTFNESCMKVLEPYMDIMTNIQGLSSKVVQSGGGHANIPGVYGSYATSAGGHGPPKAETIDVALGNALPSIFNHLSFEMGSKKDKIFKYSKISATGKNSPAPTFVSPVYAYRQIFGAIATTDRAKNELARKRNVLDFLTDDVKNLQKDLTQEEKEKLDHYLQGFETLQNRENEILRKGPELLAHAPEQDDDFSKDVDTYRLAAHFELAAAALITGMTNVVSIRCDNLENLYEGLGNGEGHDLHYIGHRRKDNQELFDKINHFQADLIARLIDKLRSIPEGNGTMMDNTLIVYSCDIGHKIHSNFDNMPLLLIGNIHKKFNNGQYLVYPGHNQQGHQNLHNLYLSFFEAIGQSKKQFNSIDHSLDKSINQNAPLEAIMA